MNRRESVKVAEVEWDIMRDNSALYRLLLLLFDDDPNTEQAGADTPTRPEDDEKDAVRPIHHIEAR